MENYSEKMSKFLDTNLGTMHKDLAVAIIGRAGGEQAFLDNCAMSIHTGTSLLLVDDTIETIEFFDKQKEMITRFVKDMIAERDEDSVVNSIASLASLDPYSYGGEIKRLTKGIQSALYHGKVASGFVSFAGISLIESYNEFSRQEFLANAQIDNETDDIYQQRAKAFLRHGMAHLNK